MTIQFSKTEEFKNAKAALSTAMAERATKKHRARRFDLSRRVTNRSNKVGRRKCKQRNARSLNFAAARPKRFNEHEMQFFNRVTTEGGFTNDSVLPVTTQERVFEDLVRDHRLLYAVGLQDLGPVTRYITADPTKAYAWGPLFGDLAGQVNAAFSEQEIGTFKLTSFAAIPNDMVELGPVWLERFSPYFISGIIFDWTRVWISKRWRTYGQPTDRTDSKR